MTAYRPRVSIGLPVFNGERFVEPAIKSLLGQTYEDFELIISDNASDDRTAQICLDYAARDRRVKYHRQPVNVGAKANFNRTFELSCGTYFKWAAADDVCGPRYLEHTVGVLDRDPSVILAHCRGAVIDSAGGLVAPADLKSRNVIDNGVRCNVSPNDRKRDLENPSAAHRFSEILLGTFWCFEIFALIRRHGMLITYPKGEYFGSDKVMLAQLCLLGKFVEVDDVQFFRRAHSDNSCNLSSHRREVWSRPKADQILLPTEFPCFKGYALAAIHTPLSFAERARCAATLLKFALRVNRYPKLLIQLWGSLAGYMTAKGDMVPAEIRQSGEGVS